MRKSVVKRGLLAVTLSAALFMGPSLTALGPVNLPSAIGDRLGEGAGMRTAGAAPAPFLEAFDGRPAGPEPWRPADWDVSVHSLDPGSWARLPAMDAQHGPDCAAPPATHHLDGDYGQAVFRCNDHVMTAINGAGYGAVYLTPPALLDFSQGEAVLRFDLSTLRTSGRDWVDVWLSPYEEHLHLPLENDLPDLAGPPRRALHVRMDNGYGGSIFVTSVFRDFVQRNTRDWFGPGYETVLTPSASRRDTFELRLSRTHVKFGMPQYGLWWADDDIADLGWDTAVVQLGHHSYNPTKDCGGSGSCGPNTWHWDNVSLSPAVPLTLLRGDRRTVDASNAAQPVRFPAPAPAGARLRFAGIGVNIEVSFDGGASWAPAQRQPSGKDAGDEVFKSYWTPVPAGAAQVLVRGQTRITIPWAVRDLTIFSPAGAAPLPTASLP
jgi:hypothetical protein